MIVPVSLGENSYDVIIERGSLSRAGELLDLDRRVLVVTDEGVPAAYAGALAEQCRAPVLRRIPQGEGSKSLAMLELLLKDMLDAGFTRSDCVCAVGGGVVGDLAGFAAACWMRGIDFYNLPTTTLSQIDSSVGGKTAVDLCGVKNVVGAFHQPRRVLIDPDTLATLPRRQASAGLAEAVKIGLTGDRDLFALFESGGAEDRTEEIVARAVALKRDVVEADERENGPRRVLNFGHTIGHGIEAVAGLPHGECVGLGMLPMCSEDLRPRLASVLEALGLPTSVRADPKAVYAAMLHDKKASGGTITVVTCGAPGSFAMAAVPPEALREKLETVVQP